MADEITDEVITQAINQLTEKLSHVLLQDFLELSDELQLNIVLIKTGQLLLANVLCHVAANSEELDKITDEQGADLKELTMTCAHTGFADKFGSHKH